MGIFEGASALLMITPYGKRQHTLAFAYASFFELWRLSKKEVEVKLCRIHCSLCSVLLRAGLLKWSSEFRIFIKIYESLNT